jgi:hypothetical protein
VKGQPDYSILLWDRTGFDLHGPNTGRVIKQTQTSPASFEGDLGMERGAGACSNFHARPSDTRGLPNVRANESPLKGWRKLRFSNTRLGLQTRRQRKGDAGTAPTRAWAAHHLAPVELHNLSAHIEPDTAGRVSA